ncbi:uncharacterized protein LOC143585895 [Bidens hawaiensis]|uniref:uncharacterized protein LOC143585895 n=1 Tax=Bidens hawaiensis TaxID=980011 RepID=UPI0040499A91
MAIALSAKNKLGFINNTVTMSVNQPHLAYWKRCNDLANGAKIYHLQKNLCQITQGSNDISTYFAKMKSNWDELNAINTISSCTYGAAHSFAKRDEDQRLIQFLVGLNPNYDMIRSNILMMQPQPSMNRAYGILMQVEK